MEWVDFVNQKNSLNIIQDKLRVTDIKCPKCGQYIFVDNGIILTTNPPKRKYICKKCNWIGYA